MKKNISFFILFHFLSTPAFSLETNLAPLLETISSTGVASRPTVIENPQKELLQSPNIKNISPSMLEALKKFFQTKLLDIQNDQQLLSSLTQLGFNNKEKIDEILKPVMAGGNPEEILNSLSQLLEGMQLDSGVQKQLIKNSPGLQIVEEQLKTAFSNLDKNIDNF